MSNSLRHRNCNTENHILIKISCYSVTMAITKFSQVELNSVIQEKLVDTKFADF